MVGQLSLDALSTNLSGTALDNLKAGSKLQPQISATLNAALKSRLTAAATAANHPDLVALINAIPAADLAAAQGLTLQAFLQQQIDPMVSSDAAKKTAVDSEIASLPLAGTVGDALNLTTALAAHPLLTGVVADAQLTSLLATSPAITAAMQTQFVTLYNANQGTISDFWNSLASNPQLKPVVPQLQLALQLGALTQNNADLAAQVQAQFHPTTLRDLTKLGTDQHRATAHHHQQPPGPGRDRRHHHAGDDRPVRGIDHGLAEASVSDRLRGAIFRRLDRRDQQGGRDFLGGIV